MPHSKWLFFLGCAIPTRGISYEISARKILTKLNVELIEMPEFNCCGLPLDPINHEAMQILAAKNLALAEQQGLNILTLCPGCASTLKKVNKTLKADPQQKDKINQHLKETGLTYNGTIETKHLLQFLKEDIGLETLKNVITHPLTNLKVAEHNGCHILRPKKIVTFDDPEDPQTLKTLIEATGAECLDYTDKTQCCGLPSAGINEKIALQLARDKLNHIKKAGAQALITICPSCHTMYDTNQPRVEKTFDETYRIPILHYPQLLGLAMGLTPQELAFGELRVNPEKITQQLATPTTQKLDVEPPLRPELVSEIEKTITNGKFTKVENFQKEYRLE